MPFPAWKLTFLTMLFNLPIVTGELYENFVIDFFVVRTSVFLEFEKKKRYRDATIIINIVIALIILFKDTWMPNKAQLAVLLGSPVCNTAKNATM